MRRAVVAVIAGLVACSRPSPGVSEPPAPKRESALELSTVMRNVHFAYRRIGDAWTAGDRSYDVRVTESELRVAPVARRRVGAAVSMKTTSIARGTARLDDAASITTLPDGALQITRGAVVETLRNDARGIEESWFFATRPGGSGDLAIELAVDGETPLEVTATGAHFLDHTTGLGVRIGHGTWIDARGERVAVPVEMLGTRLVYRVPDDVVARAAYPAVLDPVISAELGMDAPVIGPADSSQYESAIACAATECLVAWTDTRRDSAQPDLFGARINAATGAVLDPTGIAIANTAGDEEKPAIAWDGTNYFVAYSYNAGAEARLVRVSTAGALLDSTPRTLATAHNPEPAIACAAGTCAVMLTSRTGAITLERFDASATALDTTPRTIATGADPALAPALAHASGTFLTAWTDDVSSTARTLRFNAAGTLLDTAPVKPLTSSGGQRDVGLGASSSGFFLAWADTRTAESELYGSRVDLTGKALDPTGIAIRKGTNFERRPRIAFNGTEWVIVYEDQVPRSANVNVAAVRVSTMGKVSDTTPIAITTSGDGNWGCVAAASGTSLVAFTDGNGSSDIYLRRWPASGSPGAPTMVSTAANTQNIGAVATGGSQYLVVWSDARSGPVGRSDVFGVRLDASGVVLDPTGIAIATSTGYEANPSVDFDGTNWMVVWASDAGVQAIRVDPAGKLIGTAPTLVGTGDASSTAPRIAFDGTNHLVTWFKGNDQSVLARHIAKDGSALDSADLMLFATQHGEPAVAFGTSDFLVSSANRSTTDLDAVRIGKTGGAIGSSFAVTTAPATQAGPEIAFGGGNFLVVWADMRNGSNSDLYGARVAPDGTVLDGSGVLIAGGSGNQTGHGVAHDGSAFFVAWTTPGASGFGDIAGTIVGNDGLVQLPTPFTIAASNELETSARVAAASKSRRLVVYARYDEGTAFHSRRVRARFVDGLTNGETCTGGTQCVSGSCVDGVCCDTACSGQCEACNVTGKVGRCSAIVGTPISPRTACGGPGAGTECGARCDGVDRSKCTYAPVDTVLCSGTGCSGGVETHASTCDGAGACKDVPKSCGVYACGTTACKVSCDTTTDCAAGSFCKANTCVPAVGLGESCASGGICSSGLFCTEGVCCGLAACAAGESCALPGSLGTCRKVQGASCTTSDQCASKQCVDGVCCDSPCAGQCEACDTEGNKGKCLPISGTPHGGRTACAKGSDLCSARTCDGSKDATQCVGFVSGTTVECKAKRCEGTKFFAATTCTGTGTCAEQVEASCVPYKCDESGCLKSCSSGNECADGFACKDGVCDAIRTKCSDDNAAVLGADGTRSECAPFLCRDGGCVNRCDSSAECAPNAVCDATSTCVPRAASSAVEDGGGCSYGARATSGAWLLLIALSTVRRSRRARLLR